MRSCLLLGLAPILAIACSTPASSETDGLSADEMTAMAVPGVDETALDRSTDPCTDFYQFSCGGYVAAQPADTVFVRRNSAELQKAHDAVMAQVYQELKTAPRTEAERNAGNFLKSCLTPSDPAKVTAVVSSFRADIEAATTSDAIARIVGRLAKRGAPAFFSLSAMPDQYRVGRRTAANASPGGFAMWEDLSTKDGVAGRVGELAGAIAQVEPALSQDEVGRLAQTAANIEQRLFQANGGVVFGPGDDHPHPVGKAGLAMATPHFDWDTYFATIGAPSDLGSFVVKGLDYFAALDGILATTPIEDLRAYLIAELEFFSLGRGPTTDEFCQQMLGFVMPDAIEPRFLELAGVDDKAQAKARALFRSIVDAFDKELDGEAFLDTSTRIEAKVKLAKMRATIGASHDIDTFTDIEIDPTALYMENFARLVERSFHRSLAQIGKPAALDNVGWAPDTINASYDGTLNKINIPGGILGGYFFSPNVPQLANFAGIGTVLGHELTHGFDNDGRLTDGDGLIRDWWTPAVADAFKARAQTLIDEYNAFTLAGVKDPVTGAIPAHVNGSQTLPENIADNGGVKTAYRASNVDAMTGPAVSGFTPAQQFFVGYAQIWCQKASPEHAADMLKNDGHSPGPARVNVPLENFDKFQQAFQCKTGTPMAPTTRGGVW
jgi:predicted metalloendopeptidase